MPSSATSAIARSASVRADPQRDDARAVVGFRRERHVRDVDARATERKRDRRHDARLVGHRDAQLPGRAAEQPHLEQRRALDRRRSPATRAAHRRRRRRAARVPPPAGARGRRSARRARRGSSGRSAPTATGSRPRRGSRRETTAPWPAAPRRPAPRPPARRAGSRRRAAGARRRPSGGRESAGAIAVGTAPSPATNRARRSYSTPGVRSPGVRYHVAPSKRSSRAWATPVVSAPASGWPPMKCSRSTASTSACFVEPTSVTTAPGRRSQRSRTAAGSASTDTDAIATSASPSSSSDETASSIAPIERAVSSAAGLRFQPTTLAPSRVPRRQADRAADEPDAEQGDARLAHTLTPPRGGRGPTRRGRRAPRPSCPSRCTRR